MSITVLGQNTLTTVQDAGRIGYAARRVSEHAAQRQLRLPAGQCACG